MSRYPEIRAGQRITGAMLTGIQFEEVVKPVATSRGLTTSVSLDPDLQFTLEGNATYHVEYFVQYAAPTSGGKIKTNWTVPSGADGLRRRIGGDGASVASSGSGAWNTATVDAVAQGVHAFSTEVQAGVRSGGGQMWMYETGVISTTNGGVTGLAWAQATSNASATEVSAYSYARLKRIA